MEKESGPGAVTRYDSSSVPVDARVLRPQYLNPDDNDYQSRFDKDTFLEYFYAVLNRKWIVAGFFVLAVAGACLYSYLATPFYRSSATIEVEKMYPGAANMNDLFSFFGHFDLYYQTQIEFLKSRRLAESFLKLWNKSIAARDSSEKDGNQGSGKTGENNLEEEMRIAGATDSVLSRITIAPVKGTQLIQVDMGAESPVLAKQMLEKYLEAFSEENRRKRMEIGQKVREWLQKELTETEKQLKESETNLLEFSKTHGVVFLDKGPNQTLSFLQKAGETFHKSKDARQNIEALRSEKDALPPQMSNEYLQNLRTQLASLKSEYTGLKAIYSPDYFKMNLLRNKIHSLEEAINEVEQSTLDSALESAKKKEAVSNEAYEKSKEEAMNMSALAVQYEILRKMVDANSQLYVMLLQKSKQAELDNGVMGHNILVANPPSLPLTPVYPVKSKIILLGAVIGLIGGIGLAIFLEAFDRSVHSPKEIERHLNIPILGEVPRVVQKDYGEDESEASLEFLAHRFPTSPFTDSIRIVQNSVSSSALMDTGMSICVSSALPLEGKTVISVVMATVVASELKRVLVIDGDMRRPRIHEVFKCKNESPGLADLITGKCVDLREAVRRSHVPGVFYMTSGSRSENPVALLKSERMQDIIEQCKREFDFVILDAPPIIGLVDASILSGYADGLILVTKSGHTPMDVLVQAKESVFRGRGRLLGIVVNMSEHKSLGSRYHYYYGYNRYYQKRTA
jgi:capsular exopolysaccharide synthesis family protein